MNNKIDKLINKLGKIEDRLAIRRNGNYLIKEGSPIERELINKRTKIKEQLRKLY